MSGKCDNVAIFPGMFDPVTHGHLDIIERASGLYDRLIVAVDGDRSQVPYHQGGIEIGLAREKFPLAVPLDYEHFRVVRTKLKWSGGLRESPEPA